MASFVFHFEHVDRPLNDRPPTDRFGLAAPTREVAPNEADMACELLPSISSATDVDTVLMGNAELKAQMVAETIDLLRSARYDTSRYEGWLGDRT